MCERASKYAKRYHVEVMIKDIMWKFKFCFGLKVNFAKSAISQVGPGGGDDKLLNLLGVAFKGLQ